MTTGAVPERDQRELTPDPPEDRGGLNTAELLYGTVVAAAVLAVASQADESAWQIIAGVVGTLVVYWLVHVYTRVLSLRVEDPSASRLTVARHAFTHESAVLLGGLPIVAVFLSATFFGLDVPTATTIALWTTVVLLGASGYGAARQAGSRGWVLLAETTGAALFGVVVVILKASIK